LCPSSAIAAGFEAGFSAWSFMRNLG
jgi:hypothetical protein